MKLAKRMSKLGTETAFEVLAKAKAMEAAGREIIHLEIGEPDFDTPSNIIEAACKALKSGYTHYTPANGMPKVREVIANEIATTREIDVHPDQVCIVPGGKPIMFFCILALCDEETEVIYPNPGFPIYESVINFAGAKAVPIPLLESKAFGMDLDDLESKITDKTRLIIINSPGNPTGGVLETEDLKRIAKIADERNIMILSDEIYSRIIYDDFKHESPAKYAKNKDNIIILDGFSKTYAMTGWRIGYGVMNKELASQVTKLMINSNSCTSASTQMAAVEAITGPQDGANKMIKEFKQRRDLIVDGLNSIKGISCLKPKGAFYVFPNVKETGVDCKTLSNMILEKAGVAVLSGTAFGEYGKGYIRLSYANSKENISKAIDKIKNLVENL